MVFIEQVLQPVKKVMRKHTTNYLVLWKKWKLFLVSLATTAFFCSVFLTRKKATGMAFTIMVLFFIIGTFYSFFDEGIQDIKYISIFFYYDPAKIIVSHIIDDYVIRDFLVLSGYSVILIIVSIIMFNRRDIPV